MRDFIKFIPFLWKSLSEEVVLYLALFLFVITFALLIYFFGPLGFLILVGGAIFFFVMFIILRISVLSYRYILKTWKKYKAIQEREAQEIVDRLKGEGHTAAKRHY